MKVQHRGSALHSTRTDDPPEWIVYQEAMEGRSRGGDGRAEKRYLKQITALTPEWLAELACADGGVVTTPLCRLSAPLPEPAPVAPSDPGWTRGVDLSELLWTREDEDESAQQTAAPARQEYRRAIPSVRIATPADGRAGSRLPLLACSHPETGAERSPARAPTRLAV